MYKNSASISMKGYEAKSFHLINLQTLFRRREKTGGEGADKFCFKNILYVPNDPTCFSSSKGKWARANNSCQNTSGSGGFAVLREVKLRESEISSIYV
jgi:hypothetical protein